MLHPQGSVPVMCVVAPPPPPVHVRAEGCPKRPVLGHFFFIPKYHDFFCDQGGGGGGGVQPAPPPPLVISIPAWEEQCQGQGSATEGGGSGMAWGWGSGWAKGQRHRSGQWRRCAFRCSVPSLVTCVDAQHIGHAPAAVPVHVVLVVQCTARACIHKCTH